MPQWAKRPDGCRPTSEPPELNDVRVEPKSLSDDTTSEQSEGGFPLRRADPARQTSFDPLGDPAPVAPNPVRRDDRVVIRQSLDDRHARIHIEVSESAMKTVVGGGGAGSVVG